MGMKSRKAPVSEVPPAPAMAEQFDSLMAEAQQGETAVDKIMFAANVAIRCAAHVPTEGLSHEQWKRVGRALMACRQLCDTLEPELRAKAQISQTLEWIK